jgi:hypothetical protein
MALWVAACAVLALPLAVRAGGHPTPAPITDDTVVARIGPAPSVDDHRALAAYYHAKSAAEARRIEFFDQLLRAYMQLEGKSFVPMQRHARELLKAARMSRKYFDLLAAAHTTMALELSQP